MTDETPDLFALLGLSRDARPDLLRYTYEQHMADATRRHDLTRAAALSQAFDALDSVTKSNLYAGRGLGERSAPRIEAVNAGTIRPSRDVRKAARAQEPQPALRWPFKIMLGLIVLLVASIPVLGLLQLIGVLPKPTATRTPPATVRTVPYTQAPPVVTPQPAQSWDPVALNNSSLFIPSNAWVDGTGMAWLHCLYQGQSSELRKTLPAQWYTCPNGAVAAMIRVH